MKKLFIICLLFLVGCSEDIPCDPTPQLETNEVTNVTDSSAKITGEITVPTCTESVTSQGFVYATTQLPKIDDNVIEKSGKSISVDIQNLKQNTTYFIRTFFENPIGVFYGNEAVFTTTIGDASISKATITNIKANSVTVSATINQLGGGSSLSKGVVFSKTPNPTINDNKTESNVNSNNFSLDLNNLDGNTNYYLKTFVTNENGTFFGNEVSFKTICNEPLGSLSFTQNRIDGNISASFNYDISLPSGNYVADKIELNLIDQNNNEFTSDISQNNLQGSVVLNNLIPLTTYSNIRIDIISNSCGTTSIVGTESSFTTPKKYDIGDVAEGGIIIYMFPNGINGIAVSEVDAGEGNWACDTTNDLKWSSYSTTGRNIDDWIGNIGDGKTNSSGILDFLENGTGKSSNGYFADFCNCINNEQAVELALNFNRKGYDDWFLPHIKTLNLIYQLYVSGTISNFNLTTNTCGTGAPIYVSSCGDGANAGWINFSLSGNNAGYLGKGSFGAVFKVRPVRSF